MKATMGMLTTAIAVLGIMLGGCGSARVPQLPAMDTYVLSGQITGDGGEPLRYASVALAGSPLGTVTNDQGRFGIDEIRKGDYGLTVIYLGFRSGEYRIQVPGAGQETVTLEMVRDPKLGPALADSLAPVTVSFDLTRSE